MQRIPEPELMDEPQQAKAYAQADFEEPNRLFVDGFRRHYPDFKGSVMVDLGCGPGDIALRFAREYPTLRIVAVDGAPAMLDLARQAVDAAGLAARVQLQQAHIGGQRVQGVMADAVVSNSLLHHLADPLALWRDVKHYGRPGAAVLVMDLLRPDSEAAAQALVAEYAADEPEVLRRDFFHSLCAAYRIDEVREQLELSGLTGLELEQVSDRHFMVWGRLAKGE